VPSRREDSREQREQDAHEPADGDAPDLEGPKGAQALRERDGDGAPRLRRGRGELVGAKRAGVGHEEPEAQHADERPDEDARELGDELLPGMGAEEIAALEIGQQVGAAAPRRR
jgi:hypothetical protein